METIMPKNFVKNARPVFYWAKRIKQNSRL